MNDEKRYAILIDGDNISAEYMKTILDEISNRGVATYKRIYGDWTRPNLGRWKNILLEYSITPIQQYSYTFGKNATDSAMIIDAMDILYSDKVDGFCLASSDSDFTKLAARLRESGMTVIGMGEEKTPRPFVAACNEFKYVDKIAVETAAESAAAPATATPATKTGKPTPKKEKPKAKPTPKPEKPAEEPAEEPAEKTSQTSLKTIRRAIETIINDNSDEDGYLMVSDVGTILPKRYPDFDVRNYGFKKLTKFLDSMDCFEMRMVRDTENKRNPNSQIAYIRVK